MEVIFVLAAATGRTLVLPPDTPFYLLAMGKEGARSFGNFFPLSERDFSRHVKIISMTEFIEKQGQRLLGLDRSEVSHLLPIAKLCVYKENNLQHCNFLWEHLRESGWQPPLTGITDCLIFDERVFGGNDLVPEDTMDQVLQFCGANRHAHYYNSTWSEPTLLHWQASEADHNRLLNHFYSFIHFTNPSTDNFYKRFVRDFLHYNDGIYCTAGKVLKQLEIDAGNVGFSTLHIRRGDFQYKETRLDAEQWYNNTKEIWKPGELLYIATDEHNKTWFDPIKMHHPIKFLDDYWDLAKLGDVDGTFLGMIDTIIASHGRTFSGTWWSTFSGYVNRMRGYLGYSMKDSWYSYLPRKTELQEWEYPHGNYPAREWAISWIGIDGDEWIEHEMDIFDNPAGEHYINKERLAELSSDAHAVGDLPKKKTGVSQNLSIQEPQTIRIDTKKESTANKTDSDVSKAIERHIPKLSLSDLVPDTGWTQRKLARGVSGRPPHETPALIGGSRGHIECDVNVDSLAYWNAPQGKRDVEFTSPFGIKDTIKYISFSPDHGGWNNVRMSMEIIFVIAAASGRTLVLPPEINLYLLAKTNDEGEQHHSFADFFPLYIKEFQHIVPVISMEEFLKREGGPNGRIPIPEEKRDLILGASKYCEVREKAPRSCMKVFDFLIESGHSPSFRAQDYCVIFDHDVYTGKQISSDNLASTKAFCGDRNVTFWNEDFVDPVLIHFRADDRQYRLLTHFYAMIHFTDPSLDNYFRRFVRDFLHYHDSIYCAAGKIVKAIQYEGRQRGFDIDENGGGGFSALHIRRGDFQFKKVKLPAEQWYNNTKEIWQPNEILYIATDEHNKSWFNPIAEHHELRFLEDYWEFAGLDKLDPNFMGMIDTIVASRSRAFAGTWFSTFSGYINRMRGYHGISMKHSWYSYLPKKTAVHTWDNDTHGLYAFEWPLGWAGIDTDVIASKDSF